jgi:hypothetical protein
MPNRRGTSGRVLRWVLISASCIFVPSALLAQPGEGDEGEVTAFAGGVFGLGSHPTVGGSAGVRIMPHALALIEGSYTPLGQYTIQPWPERSTVVRSHLTDFDFSIHIPVTIKEKWSPYGIVGVGLLWDALHQNSVDSHGVAVTYGYNQFNAAFETGAGLRYYIRDNWGIRPELKVIISKQTYTRVSIGIFYVVPSNWP